MFYVSLTKHLCGMATGYSIRRNVTNDTTSGLNNCTLSYFHTAQYNHATANPHVVTNFDIFINIGIIVRNRGPSVEVVILTDKKTVRARVEVISYCYLSTATNYQSIKMNIRT